MSQPKIEPNIHQTKKIPLLSHTHTISSPSNFCVSFKLLRERKREMGTINQGVSLFDEPQNIINTNNTNTLGFFFSFPNHTLSSSSSPSSLVSPFLGHHSFNSFIHNNSPSFVTHPRDPINPMANLPETLISISSLSPSKQKDAHDGIVNLDHHRLTGGISSQRPYLNQW